LCSTQNQKSIHTSSLAAKEFRAVWSVGKNMAAIFLDHESVLRMKFLHNENTNCLVLLWYSWEFTGGLISEGQDCCTKASWFGMIMPGDILQTGPVNHCGPVAVRLWATLSMVLISLQVICKKCQHKASCYFLAMHTWHQFFIGGIQAFAMVGQMIKWQWWLHQGLMCTICYPCATYTLKSK
jgi:hypothetical protein